MKYSKIIENLYFDLQRQIAFVNSTWKTKLQKNEKKSMSENKINWYYGYAIQRGKYRVYLKYRDDIFNSLQKELDLRTLEYLGNIFNSFSDIRFIPSNNEV